MPIWTVQRELTENIDIEADTASAAVAKALDHEPDDWQIIDGPEMRVFDAQGEREDDWEYPE